MGSLTLLLACCTLSAPAEPCRSADLAAYEEARSQASPDADAQVRLALWCEARGLKAERVKHLALAVLREPGHAAARGLMGLVSYQGRWKSPAAVADAVRADEALTATLAEYNGRRERAGASAEGQWKLALWCEENGLEAEAKAHLTAVVRLDPSRDPAWKRLGCKKVNGRWVTEDQLAAEKAERSAQEEANRKWKPLLTKWRGWLGDKDEAKCAEASQSLAEVSDPRAVSAIWAVFVSGDAKFHPAAVRLLGQIDAADSSMSLAWMAAFAPEPEVRRAAKETLRRRDAREYAGLLISLMRRPLRYEVRPVNGPGSRGVLFIEGERFNVQRVYDAPGLPRQYRFFADWVPVRPMDFNLQIFAARMLEENLRGFAPSIQFSPDGVIASRSDYIKLFNGTDGGERGINTLTFHAMVRDAQITRNIASVQQAANASLERLAGDVKLLESENVRIVTVNRSIAEILNETTGAGLSADLDTWADWLTHQNGYTRKRSYMRKPTLVVDATPFQPLLDLTPLSPYPVTQKASCFAAGTRVQTLNGPRPIESIRIGDRVLTQQATSAELGYQPVTAVHHNPPSPTFLVKIKGDTIVSSPFHRFWVVGKGWVMARDLKGGEMLRLLAGPAAVESVADGPVQPVFNLDVAEAHNFFAGSASALVHDNTLPDTRLRPFDAMPELATR